MFIIPSRMMNTRPTPSNTMQYDSICVRRSSVNRGEHALSELLTSNLETHRCGLKLAQVYGHIAIKTSGAAPYGRNSVDLRR